METPNAFIGHIAQPTLAEIQTALGPSAALWQQLVDWVTELGVAARNGSRPRPSTDGRYGSS